MKNASEIISYLTLRKIIGILGAGLPIILVIWGFFLMGHFSILPSLSDYYRLRSRDAFVGILFTIGWFLFSYKGYEKQDGIAGTLAGIFAILVALFPVNASPWEHNIHLWSSVSLFLVLSYFSLILFTKTNGNITPQKIIRNRIYRISGIIMLACIVSMAIEKFFMNSIFVDKIKLVFFLETIALFAFGFSWAVKGEILWKDKITENINND